MSTDEIDKEQKKFEAKPSREGYHITICKNGV